MSTPILYKANETNFNTLGLGALPDSMSAIVPEGLNGEYYLEMKYPVAGPMFNELKNDRLIKADASNDLKQQRFKIVRITKPSKGIVTVYAEHISYHTQELQLKPKVQFVGDATSALNTWKNNLVDAHPFTIYSDITRTSSGLWEISKVENARKALGGVAGSILDNYGGEYRFDNYHIGLYSARGSDKGAMIAYGKNLLELEQEEEISNTYTSVYPYSVTEDNGVITLPEFFIDSQYVGNYARRKILLVDFSEEKITTVAQLRSRTASYITSNSIGVPKVNLKVKFVDLASTLDYKHLKLIEEINLGDWVNIYFEKLNIRTRAKVIKTTWNVLLDRYDEIELGDSRASLSQSIGATVDGKLETITATLNLVQISADGKTMTYRGPEEPTTGKLGDLWYKPIGDGQIEMYQHDGDFWRFVMSTAKLDQVAEDVAKAISDIETVTQSANDAVSKADQAVADVGFLKPDVATAKTNAATALSNSDTAVSNAGLALSNSNTAISNAQTSLTRVGSVEEVNESLQTSFDTLTQTVTLKADKSIVDGINSTVTTQGTAITANATAIGLKADKTVVDTLSQTVTKNTADIEITNDGLALKAEKSVVDAINSTVGTHTTQIKATSDGLALKADSLLVNTIKGTVDTHSTQISANSTAITARMTSTQVETLLTGKKYVNETTLAATSAGLTAQITQVSTDLSNLEISERNIYLKSKATVTNSEYVLHYYAFSQKPIGGEKYTIVVKGIINSTSHTGFFLNIYDGAWYPEMVALTSDDLIAPGVYRKTFIMPILNDYINSNIYTTPIGNGITSTVEWVKLVRGEKTSKDWSPAPEDMATVEKVVTIEANIDGINTLVASKASQTQVTQLAGQISTKVESSTYNSKITQLDNAINLRVQASDVTAAILADKKIKDTRNDNQMPAWYYSTYPNQTVEEFKYRNNIGAPGTTTYGQLTTKVPWNDNSGGSITQVFSSGDGVFQRTSNWNATEWGAWDKVIEATELLSQINVQAGKILIQTGKLYLDAETVTFSGSAFIPSAAITSLTADKINTGTLNAANVNLINMNASNISTGTVNGVNSSWNLNSGLMVFKNPSTGDSLEFTQGEIRFQNGAQGRYLKYQSEGLLLQPFAGNTGTSKNTALHLIGGGPGSYQYIQFVSQDLSGVNMRLQAEGQNMTAFHGSTGSLVVSKYGDSTATGTVISGGFETRHPTGVSLRIAGNSISTPRDGARDIYLTSQGTGSVVAGAADGTRYNMVASDFVKQSTRESKQDIKDVVTSGLAVINRLNPVSYRKKDKVRVGIDIVELGFIAEDSIEVATQDLTGIYDSHILTYAVKGIQEIDVRLHNNENKTEQLDVRLKNSENIIEEQRKKIEALELKLNE